MAFRKLEGLFGEVVMCPTGQSMLGLSTPEGRLYFAATRELTYTMRDLITSGLVGVNTSIGRHVSTDLVSGCCSAPTYFCVYLFVFGSYASFSFRTYGQPWC